jgi:predicted nucleic acid-binding protein
MNRNDSPIFVDANIPMYAHGRDHPLRQVCRTALARLAHGEIEACTSTEIHQEILYRYLSLGRPEQALQVSRDFMAVVPVVLPVTRQDIERAWELMAVCPGLRCRNYIHAAVMLNNQVTHILSTDAHFDVLNETVRIPPESL